MNITYSWNNLASAHSVVQVCKEITVETGIEVENKEDLTREMHRIIKQFHANTGTIVDSVKTNATLYYHTEKGDTISRETIVNLNIEYEMR